MKNYYLGLPAIVLALIAAPTFAGPIAGVDFEDAENVGWDRAPDDLDPDDGISVSADWDLEISGHVRNDNGANAAGASGGNFPARLQSDGSWSITIPDTVVLNLTDITFDVRGATGSTGVPSGRSGSLGTSLDGGLDDTPIWNASDLVGRPTWTPISVDLSDAIYQGLTDTAVTFFWNGTSAIDLDTIVLNGETGAPSDSEFAITEFDYDPEADSVTLTWPSSEGDKFAVFASTDLKVFDAELDDEAVAGAGDMTTRTYNLSDVELEEAERVYIRVERLE